MIVKDHEKKAVGFISVTWITVRTHVSALPGPPAVWRRYTPGGPRDAMAGPRMPLRSIRSPRWKEDGRRPSRRGPMLRNDGMPALSANTPVRAACRGWPWLTCSPPGEVRGLAAVSGDLLVDEIPPGRHYGG
jgi:hypothetical protein